MERVTTVSTATAVADVLREEILRRQGEDPYLGQEDDLLARLGVSRPTLRQAVRLLQAEGILTVRRGHHGGLYGRRPDAAGVAHMASVFLRTRQATVADVSRAHHLVMAECARLAASNPDQADRARLAVLVAATTIDLPTIDPPTIDLERGAAEVRDAVREHARARIRWGLMLADIARSPTLRLFEEVLGSLSRVPTTRPVLLEPTDIARTQRQWRLIADAVAEGAVEQAVRRCREHADVANRRIQQEPDHLLGW